MSLDYDLKIETSLDPRQILEIVAKANGIEAIDTTEPYSFQMTGASVVAMPIENDIGKRLILEGYGFVPNLLVSFEYHISEPIDNIAHGVSAILREVPGNAVLLWNGEETIAKRINGKLEVQLERYEWLLKEFDLAGLKYERCELESPLIA